MEEGGIHHQGCLVETLPVPSLPPLPLPLPPPPRRHEHECLVRPTRSLAGGFYISQPGSSVATSLVEGEATPKQVGVLDVREGNFRLFPVPLRQVCPSPPPSLPPSPQAHFTSTSSHR